MTQSEIMIAFDKVSKRYSRKGRGGSLRDTIPALADRILRSRRTKDGEIGREDFFALRDASFQVRRGEALGIIGHNGAGKSTALKLLAGVTAPTVGKVTVRGRFAALIELGAGFHTDLTGRENVYLNGAILGLSRAEIHGKLESIIDFAGLENFIDMPVKHYSSGMYARLGFAVAAHVEPEVLLIDEVLSVGDFSFQQKCLRKMREFRESGAAIIFVSHNMNAIASLCSNAILLQQGRVIAQGTPPQVIESYTSVAYEVVSDDEADKIIQMEHGRVSRHLEITSGAIFDETGRPTRSFQSGGKAVVVVNMQAHRELRDPIVGITIRGSDGTTVYDTNSAYQRIPLGMISAGEELRVEYHLKLNLCAGSFEVAAGAAPVDGRVLLDWRENLVSFDVYSDEKAIGIADLRSSMEVTRSNPNEVKSWETA
jgi:ABC-type polysaccharide/polyol phosphate transport system ATPase subunit